MLASADVHMLSGEPGPAICQLARELSARAIVIGTRWPRWPQTGPSRFCLRSRGTQCSVQRGCDEGLTLQEVR